MRRYIFDKIPEDAVKISIDVLIAGCGIAGLFTALNLDPKRKCILLNKAGLDHANSMYAQGGIAAVIEPHVAHDSNEQHYRDTLEAGAGHCNKKAVRVLVDEAWSNIEELIELGVPFDSKDGKLLLTREGGHNKNRILHSGGDATGLHMTQRLIDVAKECKNIKIMSYIFITDIITDKNDKVCGALALGPNDEVIHFLTSNIVIASGGIGRVYKNSTNAECATGDGIAAAERAGAKLKDMEFVQFHPTALVHPDETGRFFLISEALRGEGAILRNRRWEPFMQGVHPLADLAPRDIVSRAIIMEMKRSNIPHVYLDLTSKSREFLKTRFPTIYEECMRRSIDIATDWIPVLPVQHYFMGGIETDIDAMTNITGLYACGETACTGVQGANRLASNSLLECLVFGKRCALTINSIGSKPNHADCRFEESNHLAETYDFDAYSTEIRSLMTKKCSIIRTMKDLNSAKIRIEQIFDTLDAIRLSTFKSIEAYNQSQVAFAILRASIKRKKSIGAHFITED